MCRGLRICGLRARRRCAAPVAQEYVAQAVRAQHLAQVPQHLQAKQAGQLQRCQAQIRGQAAEQCHGTDGAALGGLAQEGQAIHARQVDVAQRYIHRTMAGQPDQGGFAIGGAVQVAAAQGAKLLGQDLSLKRVVFQHQDAERFHRVSLGAAKGCLFSGCLRNGPAGDFPMQCRNVPVVGEFIPLPARPGRQGIGGRYPGAGTSFPSRSDLGCRFGPKLE
ncbi:hypothetical protein D9M69_572170 [compost metagenome]